jgi:hypothetical protein
MKRLKILSILCIILGFITVNANSQTDLTLTQLKEFNKQKLSLELVGVGMGSYGSGSISYSSWTKWKASQGFNPISESEFYKITGYEDLASKSKKREKTGKTLKWTGLGLGVGGCVVMFATMNSDSSAPLIAGASAALVGVGLMYGSMGINTSNMKPYGVASGMADEYNLQLTITIKKNF